MANPLLAGSPRVLWLPRWLSGKKKNSLANAGDARDAGLIPGLGRSPGEGNGNPIQYSCLGNPMDKGAWQAILFIWGKELKLKHFHGPLKVS